MARMLFALGLVAGMAGHWGFAGFLWTWAGAAVLAWLVVGPTKVSLL